MFKTIKKTEMKVQILKKLKDLRLKHDARPVEIADYLEIDESTYLKMESGKNNTWGDYLFKLLAYYKVDPSQFFSEIEGKNFVHHQENKDNAIGQVGTMEKSSGIDDPLIQKLLKSNEDIIQNERDQKIHFKDKYYRAKDKVVESESKIKELDSRIKELEAKLKSFELSKT
jgi:transcriptional regulator with XRE-family HTH domain